MNEITKLMYQLQYTPEQANMVRLASQGHLGMADISDLDPSVYDDRFMRVVACGRGANAAYGNIDDLDPNKYEARQAIWVSKGRAKGDIPYANVDDLDPGCYPADVFEEISRYRFSLLNDKLPEEVRKLL